MEERTMDNGLSGEYHVSLDERGRIAIPVKLRADIAEQQLVLTKWVEDCLVLFYAVKWEGLEQQIMQFYSPLKRELRYVQRRIIAPAMPCALDKHGRLSIPATFAKDVAINRECVLLGMNKYIELWGIEQYQKYNVDNRGEIVAAAEQVVASWEDLS